MVIGYAFAKYPNLEDWDISILEKFPKDTSREQLNDAEKWWIHLFDSFNTGYNMNLGGGVITSGPMSDEHKQALSEARNKFYATENGQEWKKILSKQMSENNPSKPGKIPWNHGVKECFSEETLSKMSKSQREKWTPEMKAERSQKTKELWEKGAYDNRPKPTEEHKKKISERMIGHPASEYQRLRASEANAGKNVSEETRRKLSEKAVGRVLKKSTCIHCGKTGAGGQMKAHHHDNCKMKNK